MLESTIKPITYLEVYCYHNCIAHITRLPQASYLDR